MKDLKSELKVLEAPYYKNNRTAKEQIHIHIRDQYDEFISNIDNFIIKNKFQGKDALEFKEKILNYCANLLEKTFENKEKMCEYFNKLIGELDIKFLVEDRYKQKDELRKTTLMLMMTGMIFAHNLEDKMYSKMRRMK